MGRLLPSARCALLSLAVWLSLGPVASQSPFQIDAFDSDKNGRLEPIEFVKVSAFVPANGPSQVSMKPAQLRRAVSPDNACEGSEESPGPANVQTN